MRTGLRRFATPAPPAAEQPEQQEPPAPGERCEMCAEPIGPEHGPGSGHAHVVDVQTRALKCTCRPCYLLFGPEGAGGGRFRAVPERYRYAPSVPLAAATWESIGIPVRMAFFFTNSAMEETVAFYPSPAGATESLLPLDAWSELLDATPAVADLTPDVEALLVNKTDDGGFECFLVPIDACYQLVGLVRTYWKGFDGGEEAWTAIDGFFNDLRGFSEQVEVRDD
ncbi:MAG: hypothetical protein GEV09_14165 [Pseudonocardiaceae bacterium]|nr:hypothetical protein [Pseudonocardiaceae bacterium]